jgi:phenylacetate-CoA ligase
MPAYWMMMNSISPRKNKLEDKMDQDRPYWDMEIEPLLNTPEMEKIQLDKLKTMLGRMKANAPFYTKMFAKAGLDPENLTGFDEFKDKIQPFDKAALRQLVVEAGGNMLKAIDQIMPVSIDDIDYFGTTTGTTGIPTPYPLTNFDIKHMWGEVMARGAWRAGIRREDRVLWTFALSMVIAGVPTMMGMQKLGATMLPVGAEAKSERILMMQSVFRGTVFAGTPSLAEYLIEQAPKYLNKQVGELGFKALVCGGEPGAGIPEVKLKLEKAYGCRIFDAGAGFGFSCDAEEYAGMHWVSDDLCYYELVDPETKQPIPIENGAKGEALFTMLKGDGFVWIRQGMGDIHQVFTEPCSCGRTGFRYKVIGRADDMLKVKGVMVYPSHIKGVINEFVPKLTGEMRIILDEKPPRVVPPLKIRIEHSPEISGTELDTLEKEVCEAMSRRHKISPKIIWSEAGSLERSHYKGQVFEKTYEDK